MKAALFVLFALLPACKIHDNRRQALASTEILSVIQNQEQAWNRGDIAGYMEGYAKSPETSFASGAKMTRGWQETLDRYQKGYDSREKMGQLEFSDLKVEMISADSAIVTGGWALQREKDRPHGLFTLIFRHLPEGWRIVHDHTSAANP